MKYNMHNKESILYKKGYVFCFWFIMILNIQLL